MNKPRLLHNIAALTSIQMLGYLLPMITLPYLTRVLGVEAWGIVALTQVVLGCFTLITNWGFGFSATRKIAANRMDLEKLSEIFMATWIAQWLLCIIAIVVIGLFISYIPFFKKYEEYYLLGMGVIVGSVMFPTWFLIGLERMGQVAMSQVVTRLSALPLIFIFIHHPSDGPRMIGILAVTSITGGIFSILWIKRQVNLSWCLPKWQPIKQELIDGVHLFYSTLSITLYTSLTPIIIGIFLGNTAVGYFSLADRIRMMVQSLTAPITQSLYPKVSYLFIHDKNQAHVILVKVSKVILLISFSSSLLIWIYADIIVDIVAGVKFRPAVTILRWLSPLPLVISISNILGVQVMCANNQSKQFNRIVSFTALISLSTILPMINWHGLVGASINMLSAECFVAAAIILYMNKTKFFKVLF
jgi:PST family polysaccharide transporter